MAVRPARMLAIWSQPAVEATWLPGSTIVRQVNTTSALVTGVPSDQRARGSSRNVTRSGPCCTSAPEGTFSASWGT